MSLSGKHKYRDFISEIVTAQALKRPLPWIIPEQRPFSFVRGNSQRTHQHEQAPGHIDDRLLGSSGALLVEDKGLEPLRHGGTGT